MCSDRMSPASSPTLVEPELDAPDPAISLSWAEAVKLTAHDPLLRFVPGFGTRRTETSRMRRRDVDLKGMRAIVPVGKRRPRELPLPRTALPTARALLDLTDGDDEYD